MFVRKSLRQAALILVTAALSLTACNMGATPAPTVDVNAINTAAVATAMGQLSAQFTQTALAAPTATATPTNTAVTLPTFQLPTVSGTQPATGALPTVSFNSTLAPGITPLASPIAPIASQGALGDSCHNAEYVADITIPDGSVMEPGEDFIKTWTIKNTGTCTWDDGYKLVFIGGDRAIDPVDFVIDSTDEFVAGGGTGYFSVPLTAPLTPGRYQGTWRMQSDSGYYFGGVVSVYFEVKD